MSSDLGTADICNGLQRVSEVPCKDQMRLRDELSRYIADYESTKQKFDEEVKKRLEVEEEASQLLELLDAKVMYLEDELHDRDVQLEESFQRLEQLEAEMSDRVAPLEFVQHQIEQQVPSKKSRKRKQGETKTMGRGTPDVLP
ncbi:rbcL, partial [Symbiodinium microadriaticum]